MRKWTMLGGGAGVGLALAGITTVFACTSLATLNLSQSTVAAGSQINVTGSAFNSVSGGNSPVLIHWGSTSGPVLGTITPDSTGAFGPSSITIPESAAPGYYTIVATQTEANGQNSWGTPARAAVLVTNGSGSAGSSASNQAAVSASNNSGIGAGLIALLAAIGVAGVLFFGYGAATFVGNYRRSAAATKVRKS